MALNCGPLSPWILEQETPFEGVSPPSPPGFHGRVGGGGTWPDSSRHINLLQLVAVQKLLNHFTPQLRGKPILLRWDNTTVEVNLNRQEVVRSPALHRAAVSVLMWTDHHRYSLTHS
ncbi:hypothetical protein VZT92_018520 [Zoarces viviparus]|uniref:Uncharacterized protein n=1 Tax=Zoarces viviparus TaxID=48416 RepID=A0AAW1EIJ3_ZOAVI